MRRGRLPSEPVQNAQGNWVCWHPGLKRKVRLAATTFAAALQEQQSFYGVVGSSINSDAPVPFNPVSETGADRMTINLDDPPANNAVDMLTGWAKSTAPLQPTTPEVPAAAPAQSPTGQVAVIPTRPGAAPKPQKGLTPEQSAKIASGLKKVVVNTNVVIVGAAIQMFGVVPAPLDREEIELLQLGWELWLDELFNKAKLKPVYLVLAGNLMIAVSMYVGGRKVEKPKPPMQTLDPTKAKSAPGNNDGTIPFPPKAS